MTRSHRSFALRHGTGDLMETPNAVLRGLAQLVLADQPIAGALVLAAACLISPWIALGALAGAFFGTVAGAFLPIYTREEWRAGLSGFNFSIMGILWAGFLAVDQWQPLLLVASLALCLFFEWLLRTLCKRFRLPPLSMPAVLTATVISALAASPGNWFWIAAPEPPLGMPGIHAAIVCIVIAASTKHQVATLQALLLSAAGMFLARLVLGLDLLSSVGLWAFAVAPASFAAQAVLVAGVLAGAAAGLMAAVLAGAIWFGWYMTGLDGITQPLLAPFVLGTWLALVAIRRLGGAVWLKPALWQAVLVVARARLAGLPAVALLGGESSAEAGLLDYCSGSWRDPELPASAYSAERFNSSVRCRRACWEAYAGLRDAARKATPSPTHEALAGLARSGHLHATVTTTVDGLVGNVIDTVELFGGLDEVHCVGCGDAQPWPPGYLWRRWDLHCPDCGGLLRPDVTPPDEAPEADVWQRARSVVSRSSVLVVIGCNGATPVEEKIVDLARRNGARIVFLNRDALAHTLRSRDVAVRAPMERTLRAFRLMLGVLRPLLKSVDPTLQVAAEHPTTDTRSTSTDTALRQ